LAEGRYDVVILVDAVAKGGEPGTLYVIDPEVTNGSLESAVPDAHGLTPDAVLSWIRQIAGKPPRIVVLGCEPGTTDESMELSEPVANSVEGALQMIRALISEMQAVPRCA